MAESPGLDCGIMGGYQAGAAWPAYQGCSTHLGQSAVTGTRTGQVNWSKFLGGITRSPAIDKAGNLYVGSGAYLFSFKPNGVENWRTFLWNAIGTAPAIGADGTIYATSNAGALVAVNPANGAHKWVYRGAWGFAINSSPIIDGEGTIYFVDNNNVVHAVQPNGQPKWKQWFPGLVFSSLTLSRDGQTVYVGSTPFGLRAINAQNGQLRWMAFPNMGEFATPTIGGDGTIYVGSSNGALYALSPFDGALKWKAERKTLLIFDEWGAITVSPAIAPNGDIVFGTKKGKLIALTRTGQKRWERDLGYAISGAPVIDATGAIYVGTASKRVHAINGSNGADIWSLLTSGIIASAPALDKNGTVFVGSGEGRFHSIGAGVPAIGQYPEPVAPQPTYVAPLPTDQNGNPVPCPDCVANPDPDHPTEVVYCPGLPTIAGDQNLAAMGYVTPRPGLNSEHHDPNPNVLEGNEEFEIFGIDRTHECAQALCNDDEVQLTAAQENLLTSDVAPSSIPLNLRVPCGAVEGRDPSECQQFDYRHITTTPCAVDADCPDTFRCGLACANGTTDCDPMTRSMFCIGTAADGSCAGIDTEADDATTCFEVSECARDEDLLDEADTAPLCDGFDANNNPIKIACDLLKNKLVDPNTCLGALPDTCEVKQEFRNLYPSITGNSVSGLLGLSNVDRCKIDQLETALAKDHGGSPSTPGKNNGKSKWGLDLNAGVDSGYDMKPLPFGLAVPIVNAGGNFAINATVMGRPITVLGVDGHAELNACVISAGASATLFNNEISLFDNGENPTNYGQNQSESNLCEGFTEQARQVGGKAKNALVNAAAVYNKIKSNFDTATNAVKEVLAENRIVTKGMCEQIIKGEDVEGELAQLYADMSPNDEFVLLGGKLARSVNGGQPFVIKAKALCARPLTRETAANVVNSLIDTYEAEVAGIASRMTGEVTGTLNAYLDKAKSKGFEALQNANGGIQDKLVVPNDLGQSFSLIGAEAVFPIGPVALVLEVQGSGGWGITGGLDYGLNYDLAAAFSDSGGKPASAFAEANVGPTAHVDVDVYVGVGFDFGIGGASVGIGGQLTLVDIQLPAFARVEAYMEKDPVGEPSGRTWPNELRHLQSAGVQLTQHAFRMKLAGSFGVKAHMQALNGELDLRLRVKLLFWKKTWKKRVAKFKGFSKDFNWAVAADGNANLSIPSPNLSVLPSIPFPKFPRLSPSDFPSLPTPADMLVKAGQAFTGLTEEQVRQLTPEAAQAKFDELFLIVEGVADYELPTGLDWDDLVPELPLGAQSLHGELKTSVDGKLVVPVECGVDPDIII